MTPSIGRIVHFVSDEMEGAAHVHWAAIVTAVQPVDSVSLTAFPENDDPQRFQVVPYADPASEADIRGTWHWPERVDAATTAIPTATPKEAP